MNLQVLVNYKKESKFKMLKYYVLSSKLNFLAK